MTTPYTDTDAVAAVLGITLTDAQTERADAAIEAASEFIEQALGRSWLEAGGEVADERHVVRGCRIWLLHPPVDPDADLTLSVRSRLPGSTTYEQTQAYQFELIDPVAGHIYTSPTLEGTLATVGYTSTQTIPALIAEFAAQLAAGMLALSFNAADAAASSSGVKSYTLWGGDLRVEYATSATGSDGSSPISSRLPNMWAQIEGLYSRRLVVA